MWQPHFQAVTVSSVLASLETLGAHFIPRTVRWQVVKSMLAHPRHLYQLCFFFFFKSLPFLCVSGKAHWVLGVNLNVIASSSCRRQSQETCMWRPVQIHLPMTEWGYMCAYMILCIGICLGHTCVWTYTYKPPYLQIFLYVFIASLLS